MGDKLNKETLKEEILQLKNELKISERKYYDLVEKTNIELKELFDNSYDLIQVFRPNGEFRFVNKISKNKLGYTDQELYDLKFQDFIHISQWASTYEKLLRLEKGEKIEKFETVFTSKTGKNIYVSGKVTCVIEDEEAIEYRAVFYDITERIRAENAQSLFYKIANLTITSSNLNIIYKNIYEELNKMLSVQNMSIIVKNKKEENYSFPFFISENKGKDSLESLQQVDAIFASHTLSINKPVILYGKKIQELLKSYLFEYTPMLWLGVPISIGGEAIGVLSIYSPRFRIARLYFQSGQFSHGKESP